MAPPASTESAAIVDWASLSGDGPASTQVNRKRALIRAPVLVAPVPVDIRGSARNPGSPAGLRRRCRVRGARHSADSVRPTRRRDRISRHPGATLRRCPACSPARADTGWRWADGREASPRIPARPCGRDFRRIGRIRLLASSRSPSAAPPPCAPSGCHAGISVVSRCLGGIICLVAGRTQNGRGAVRRTRSVGRSAGARRAGQRASVHAA